MAPEQKRRLEKLRELAAEIERLQELQRDVPRPAGKRALHREIQVHKAARRDLVRALVRDGVEAAVIAPAADMTRTGVASLGRSR